MRMIGDCRKEIIDTRQFADRLYESKYSDVFEKLDRFCDIPKTDTYENNPFLNTAYRDLHDTGLM